MNNTEKRLELFREKIKTYDKDGGFIVYVEDEDNQDFDVELIENFLAESIAQAKQEVMKRVVEKWDKYVDVINEDAHYVIHNPVREGFKVVLSSLQIINLTKEE